MNFAPKYILVVLTFLLLAGCQNQTKEGLFHQGETQMKQGNPLGAVVFFTNALEKDPNYIEARYQLGLAYLKSGKLDKAEQELKKVKLQRPDNADVLLDLAALYFSLGKIENAESEISQFLVKHKKNSRSQEYQARILIKRGDVTGAVKLFREAVKLDGDNIDARLALAQLYLHQSNNEQARQILNIAIEEFPKLKAPYFMLAALEAHQGYKDKALSLYQHIIEMDRKDIGALYLAGMLALDMGNIEEATRIADILHKQFPQHPATFRILGMLNYIQGNLADAVGNLQLSLKKMPDFTGYYFLGIAEYKLGQYELALNQFQKALDLRNDNSHARLMVGMTLLKQKRLDDCIRQVSQVLRQDDKIAMAHNIIGSAYLAKGEFDEAMQHLDRAIALNPELADAHMKKGLFNLSRGDSKGASLELEKAVKVAPEALNPRILLVSLQLRQQNYQGAIETLKAGINGNEQDALLYNYMAAAYFAQKQIQQGIESLEKAKQLKPDYLTPYFNLARYYLADKQRDKALDEYRAILKITPDNVKALLAVAGLEEMKGNTAAATAGYKAAGATKTPQGLLAQAGYLLRSKQPDKALKVVDDAYQLYPHNPAILKVRGKLFLGQKKYTDAVKMFKALEKIKQGSGVTLMVEALLGSGDREQAMSVAQKLIDEHPDSAAGYMLQAAIYQRLAQKNDAESALKKGIETVKNPMVLSLQLGELYVRSKQITKAENILIALHKKHPNVAPVGFALGAFYDQQGDKRKAVALYREVLAKNGNYTAALNNLAYLYAGNYGASEEALPLAIKAFNSLPSNPGIIDTLGFALLKNKRYDEAINMLRKAVTLLPNVASVRLHLGQALLGAGKIDEARSQLQIVVNSGSQPESDQATQMLAGIE